MLSFDQFELGLSERVTFVVGPNGAGKSNLTRLLTICRRAVESGDGGAGDVDRMLAWFLAARHVGSQSPGVEARVGVRLTDLAERELVTQFVRAMVTGALTARRQVQNMAEIDAWAEAEITEDKLLPLRKAQSSPATRGRRMGGGSVPTSSPRPDSTRPSTSTSGSCSAGSQGRSSTRTRTGRR